jgi:hypothetical protein
MKSIRTKETYKCLAKRAGIATIASFAVFVALFYYCVQLASHKPVHHSSTHPNFDWIAIFCDLALLTALIFVAVYLAAVILKCFAPKEPNN